MINEIMNEIIKLKRPELVTDSYGNQFIYNDENGSYSRLPKNYSVIKQVCNVESLAKAVVEEMKRKPGTFKTVIFERQGATFYTNDSLGKEQDIWHFAREYTTLWETVKELCEDQKMKHKTLLEKLEAIKIFIADYEDIYQTISRLRASKKVSFVSNPIFTDGEQSGCYTWEQRVDANGATEKAICPSEIRFKGKIVRGSEAEYQFSLSITPVIDEEKGQILFSLSMPGLDMVLDQVREDEYADFNKLIGDIGKEILVLRNY